MPRFKFYSPDNGAGGQAAGAAADVDVSDIELESKIVDSLFNKLKENGLGLVNLKDLENIKQKEPENNNKDNSGGVDTSLKILEAINNLNNKVNTMEQNVYNNLANQNEKDRILSSIPKENLDIAETLFNALPHKEALEKISKLNLSVPRNGNYNQTRILEEHKTESKKMSETNFSKKLGLTENDYLNGMDNGQKIMDKMTLALGKVKLIGAHGVSELIRSDLSEVK